MQRTVGRALLLAALLCGGASAASAGEMFGGLYAHGVGTKQSQEGGADLQLGVRSDRIESLWWLFKPAVHGVIGINSAVSTDFVAVGLNWPIPILHSEKWYIRPGIGFAYTTGKADIGSSTDPRVSAAERARRDYLARTRIDFGSQDLFEPELSIGYKLNPKWQIEASYVHLSNGQILHSGKNQGLDDVGVRLAYRFH